MDNFDGDFADVPFFDGNALIVSASLIELCPEHDAESHNKQRDSFRRWFILKRFEL